MYSKSSNWIDSLGRSTGSMPSTTAPPRALHEIAVEKSDRGRKTPAQFGLPIVPCLEFQIGPGYPPPLMIEDVDIIAARIQALEEFIQFVMRVGLDRLQLPCEHALGVSRVILRVAPRAHVENNAAPALLIQAGLGEMQPKLGFAYAGCPYHGR